MTFQPISFNSSRGPTMNSQLQPQGAPNLVWKIRNACIPTWLLIIVFGVVGNGLTVVLLNSPNLSRHSTSVYLRWLAVVDILYLMCSLAVNWISYVAFFPNLIREKALILCLGLPYLHYTLSYLSVWLLVAVTVDRMIWVVLPFSAKKICNHKNAFIVVMMLVLFFCAIDIQFFFSLQFDVHPNSTDNETVYTCEANSFGTHIYPYIDLVLLFLIPVIFMVICNSSIIYKLRRHKRMRQTRLQCPAQNSNLSNHSNNHQVTLKSKAAIGSSSLTAMLLSINLFFVISITPLLIYDIIYYAVDIGTIVSHNEDKFGGIVFGIEQIVYTLWYLNFSAHFLLYCMSGPRFRSEAVKLFRCKKAHLQDIPDDAVTEFITKRIISHPN